MMVPGQRIQISTDAYQGIQLGATGSVGRMEEGMLLVRLDEEYYVDGSWHQELWLFSDEIEPAFSAWIEEEDVKPA